jgi:hypothetical protein
MTRIQRLFLLAVSIGLLGAGIFFGSHVIARQKLELTAWQRKREQIASQLAAERQAADDLGRELANARGDLNRLSPMAAGDPVDQASLAREAQIQAWLTRVKQLKAFLAQHPEHFIPEMRGLNEDDWLLVAKNAQTDDEDGLRKAFGELREKMKVKFAGGLTAALRKFMAQRNGQLPSDPLELAPYFGGPVDPDVLQRYEMTTGEAPGELSAGAKAAGLQLAMTQVVLRERAAVDEQYDSRINLGSNGSLKSSGAPGAWIDGYDTAFRRANQAYLQANQGQRSSSLADLLPYFDIPLSPAQVASLLKAEKDQNTRMKAK